MRRRKVDAFTRFSYACLFAAILFGVFEIVLAITSYAHMVD